MKKNSRISGLGFAGALMLCAAVGLWTAAQTAAQTGEQYCDISLSRCPESYDGDTLQVPLSVISLSSKIRACATTDSSIVDRGDPPAIMFIIDHTGTMATNQNGGAGNDTSGNRFKVTRELIDSVYAKFPNAMVGVTVFHSGLFLHPNRGGDPNLVEFGGTQYNPALHESYMPLMQLNQPAKGGGFYQGTDDPKAIDVFHDMFFQGSVPSSPNVPNIPNIPNRRRWGIRNTATPTEIIPEGQGTNITIAFEAALEQFNRTDLFIDGKQVKNENKYIIFLSDGDYGIGAALPGEGNGFCSAITDSTDGTGGTNPRCARQRDFLAGEIPGYGKIPATYTVFLTSSSNPPANAARLRDTMTVNIKNNGYSETNATSGLWPVAGNQYQALLDTLMNNVVNKIVAQTQVVPKRIVVTSWGVPDSTGEITDGGEFAFGRMLPIDTVDVASVKMGLRYVVNVDTIDGNGNDSSYTFEKMQEYSFWIKRTANPSKTLAAQGLTSNCGSKPSIALLYNGEPVTVIKGNMSNLTVQFSTSNFFEYTRDNVNIQVRTTMGADRDTLYTKALGAAGKFREDGKSFYWDFERRGAPTTVTVGDIILQHNTTADSVVLFFRNPVIPLDTIRVSYPYLSNTMVFSSKPNDLNALIPNPVTVKAGETLDIYALLLDADNRIDAAALASGAVTWTISSTDGAKLTPDPSVSSHATFIGTKAPQEYVVTATFKSGSLEIKESFTINVVPGDAAYLEVVFVDPDKTRPPAQADTAKLKENKNLEIPKGVNERTVWAVERDKYGNYIGLVPSASWSREGAIGIIPGGSSAAVKREDESYSAGNLVIVRKPGTDLVDTVLVTVVGNASAAIGPNPFIPNESKPRDIYLDRPQNSNYAKVGEYYRKILEQPSVGGGVGTRGGDDKGILVAGTAPKGIVKDGKNPKATIIIYDAVGNIVFKSLPSDVTLVEENNTFGFVWNGKNNKGRTVGPGTYLVRMYVELEGNDKFFEQSKIGVTKAKKP